MHQIHTEPQVQITHLTLTIEVLCGAKQTNKQNFDIDYDSACSQFCNITLFNRITHTETELIIISVSFFKNA